MNKFDFDEMMIEHNQAVRFVDIDPSTTNVYAIGDVHGCFDEMMELYGKCVEHAAKEGKVYKIFFLGDLIDRGPGFLDIFHVLENDSNLECIIGNHELNFYLEQMGKECRSRARRVNHDIFETLDKDSQAMILKSIGDMPNAVVVNLTNDPESFLPFILSHSPVRDIEYIGVDVLSTMNAPQCCMRPTPVDMDELQKIRDGIIMVHGHQSWNFKPVPEQILEQYGYSNRVLNIDSGCVYGDKLTALCLNTLEVLDLDAHNVYHAKH